jgi:hypothetical protein
MRGCISTSERAALALVVAAGLALAHAPAARAADVPAGGGKDKMMQPEEDDFSSTPFTEYGEFNEEQDEAADTRFFQYGRFFGVSVGVGAESISGNRGLLWQGGWPLLDFKVHYWFDFNVALDLGVFTAPHFYDIASDSEHVDVSMVHLGVDVKYYFDTKNLSAAISFANPYVVLGFGSYSKTEVSTLEETTEQDTAVGLNAGAGLEFAIRHRKVYFQIEGKAHFATFKDTFTTEFRNSAGLDDLQGNFFTVTAALMFTW